MQLTQTFLFSGGVFQLLDGVWLVASMEPCEEQRHTS